MKILGEWRGFILTCLALGSAVLFMYAGKYFANQEKAFIARGFLVLSFFSYVRSVQFAWLAITDALGVREDRSS